MEEEIAQLVVEVLDKVDAAPERFQAEADQLGGATLNQFKAMAIAHLIVDRLIPDAER